MSTRRPEVSLMRTSSATLTPSSPTKPLDGRVRTALRQIADNIRVYVAGSRDSLAAAALYHDLSRLSDAELARRGLARGDIHRIVSERLAPPAGTNGSSGPIRSAASPAAARGITTAPSPT